jgi:hypothetical protein
MGCWWANEVGWRTGSFKKPGFCDIPGFTWVMGFAYNLVKRRKTQMTEKPNQPREYDAVLGGKNSPPVNAAVLGGIEGVKRRLTANDELVRVGAVREAMKYGEAGLDVAIASLDDNSPQVRREAIYSLQKKTNSPQSQTPFS